MEVDVLPSTNVTIIKCLDSHFARYGVLVGLATYIGSKFVSEVKKTYLVKMAIIYHHNIHYCGQEPMVKWSMRTVH